MQFVETLLLSLALIVDSFTIAASFGLVEDKATFLKNMNIIGITCEVGQVFFIGVGWLLGSFVVQFVLGIGPWAGFCLLTLLSAYLVIDAFKKRSSSSLPYRALGLKIILFLVVATSFDVLSVGLTLGLLQESILILMIVLWVFTYVSA